MSEQNINDLTNGYYFSSPLEAVDIITSLLNGKNFKKLSCYYDLSSSDIKKSKLITGEFFIRTEPPEIAHPAGFWRYKHPFAPGFKYSSSRETSRESVYIIEVSISIDQGVGTSAQISFSHFYMKKYEKGWKVLPDKIDDNDLHVEMPKLV